ncbi:hypothetical protein ARMSODRAFT_1025838 [Armillaria solidipes]|uniref:Uncharacterized protein n=1 Tax=Armillaria solidipes TaxID=1076256 RepID=A0A2H3ARB2_9AGAR|nr:hypothetical protein ARMSODRAFT_1025838 [Armillaria solidipes]
MSDQFTQDFLRQIPPHKLKFLVAWMLNQQQKTARKFKPVDVDVLVAKVKDVNVDWQQLETSMDPATIAVSHWLSRPENARYIPESLRTPPSSLTTLPDTSPPPVHPLEEAPKAPSVEAPTSPPPFIVPSLTQSSLPRESPLVRFDSPFQPPQPASTPPPLPPSRQCTPLSKSADAFCLSQPTRLSSIDLDDPLGDISFLLQADIVAATGGQDDVFGILSEAVQAQSDLLPHGGEQISLPLETSEEMRPEGRSDEVQESSQDNFCTDDVSTSSELESDWLESDWSMDIDLNLDGEVNGEVAQVDGLANSDEIVFEEEEEEGQYTDWSHVPLSISGPSESAPIQRKKALITTLAICLFHPTVTVCRLTESGGVQSHKLPVFSKSLRSLSAVVPSAPRELHEYTYIDMAIPLGLLGNWATLVPSDGEQLVFLLQQRPVGWAQWNPETSAFCWTTPFMPNTEELVIMTWLPLEQTGPSAYQLDVAFNIHSNAWLMEQKFEYYETTEGPLENGTRDVFVHPNTESVPLLQPGHIHASALPVTIHLKDQRFPELLIHHLQVDGWLFHQGAFYARLQPLARAIARDIGLQDLADKDRAVMLLPRMVGRGTTQLYVGYLGMDADTGIWKAGGPAFLQDKNPFVGMPVSPGNDGFYFHCRLSITPVDFVREFHRMEATEHGPKMQHFQRITDSVWLIPYELGDHCVCDHDHGKNDTPTIWPVVVGPSHRQAEVDNDKAPARDAAPSEPPKKPNATQSRASQKSRKLSTEDTDRIVGLFLEKSDFRNLEALQGAWDRKIRQGMPIRQTLAFSEGIWSVIQAWLIGQFPTRDVVGLEYYDVEVTMAHWEKFFGCSHAWFSQIRDIGRYVDKEGVDAAELRLKEEASFIDPVFTKGRNKDTQRWHGAGRIVEKLRGLYGALDPITKERKANPRPYGRDS